MNVTTVVFGAIPPPLGGVAVYCKRRIAQLNSEFRHVLHIDSRDLACFYYLMKVHIRSVFYRSNIVVEVNVSNLGVLIFLLLIGLSRKCIFIDHNGSRRNIKNSVSRFLFHRFAKTCKKIIVVNKELIKNYPLTVQSKIELSSPFIPPEEIEFLQSANRFKEDGYKFLVSNESKERDIILCSAWKASDSAEEPDLYGLYDTLEIYEILIPKLTHMKFVLLIGEEDGSDLYKSISDFSNRLLKTYDNFTFLVGGYSQLALLPHTKYLLRLTKTDGDSVSIREAIHFGVKVISSDVVSRPEGVITFAPKSRQSVVSYILNESNSRQ